MTTKKIPMRMCVGCREKKPKAQLIRIVRSKEGEISADATGKLSGRGAYICKSVSCLDKAQKIKAIDRALEQSISNEVFDGLREALEKLE